MSTWQSIGALANVSQLRTWGIPVIYQPSSGVPAVSIVGIRGRRDSQETGQQSQYERIWTTVGQPTSQLQTLPAKGDWITIGGTQYTVHSVKPGEPDDDGIWIYLSARNTNA
jgi:hypothetical protein